MSDRLDQAVSIAREAGALQRERFSQERTIETKSSAIDLVTDVDRASDELIVRRIAESFADDAILSEETGRARDGESGYRWDESGLRGSPLKVVSWVTLWASSKRRSTNRPVGWASKNSRSHTS